MKRIAWFLIPKNYTKRKRTLWRICPEIHDQLEKSARLALLNALKMIIQLPVILPFVAIELAADITREAVLLIHVGFEKYLPWLRVKGHWEITREAHDILPRHVILKRLDEAGV